MNDITEAWKLYQSGVDYNHRLKPDLYETVSKNEKFDAGDQWDGIQAKGMPMSVFNVFKRVIRYVIAVILNAPIKIRYSIDNIPTETNDPIEKDMRTKADKLTDYAAKKWEKLKMDSMLREGLHDAAISGDMCAMTLWDGAYNTGQTYGKTVNSEGIEEDVPIMGDFYTELVDNVNVMFGNPNDRRINCNGRPIQPYILVYSRGIVSELKEEARSHGVSEDDIKNITPDNDYLEQSGDRGKIELENSNKDDNGKCGYLIKMWLDKKTKTIWWSKSTKHVDIIPKVNMDIRIYPIAWFNWDARKNSYHGQALGTGLIPNQIVINKLHGMISKWIFDMAFGKVAYDTNRIAAWSNAIGVAIPVDGDIGGAVQQLPAGQINNIVIEFFNITIQKTFEMMGINDIILGNVRPENATAIIAMEKQTNMPHEATKQNLYQFVEDIASIWLEFMLVKYDVPRNLSVTNDGKTDIFQFDTEDYKNITFNTKIDVGATSNWNEITALQTLDNLLKGQYINFVQYLERMPKGLIDKKDKLLAEKTQEALKLQEMQTQQPPPSPETFGAP